MRCQHELGNDLRVNNMLRLVQSVTAISPETIPGDSILRETIGNSQLEY